MAASYPSGIKSFTTKLAGQPVASAHMNEAQDEIVAVEGALINGVAHTLKPDGDVTRTLGVDATRWAHPAGAVGAPGVAFTGDGDTGLYHSGANALDFATNGVKALGIDSTQFVDSPTQPRAGVFHSTTQTLTDSTDTLVVFDSEDYDVGAMHSTVSNTSRLTVPTGGDGLYLVIARIAFGSNATGYRQLRFSKNGTALSTIRAQGGTASGDSVIQISDLFNLAAADYVEVKAYQTSGGNLTIGNASRSNANQMVIVKLW